MKILLKRVPTREIPPHETTSWKIATRKILTWNIPTNFINCLSSFNPSFGQTFTNVKTSALLKHIITKQSFK